jgi:hypothetical protein
MAGGEGVTDDEDATDGDAGSEGGGATDVVG